MRKSLLTLLAATVLGLTSLSANANEYRDTDGDPSAGAMTFDLLVARPLGLVATVAGAGLFVLQLPLSVIQGVPPSVPARKLVVEPAEFTFSRPLGAEK